jgi:tetratricopeptide (TPR) repeat protein
MTSAFRCVPLRLRLFPVVTVLCIAGCASQVVDPRPQVLYLHTEFLPYKLRNDPDLSNRLNREIVRQALLVAARDGLGVQTCDETLQETPPDDAHVVHLTVTERCGRDGKWHIALSKFAEEKDAGASKPVWEKTYDCDKATTKIYADAIPKLEADSRGELIEALKTAGLHPEKHTPTSDPKEQAASKEPGEKKDQKEQVAKDGEKDAKPSVTPNKVRELLLTPDFVSQFGAVRAAHQAIQSGGETPEWLGVLARGYANLATLTHHHWSSATEVFTARAWLYGQRMAATKADDSFALANRAYAWALGGSFQNALADFDRIDKLPAAPAAAPAAAASKDAPSDDRQWLKLARAFVSCDRGETWQVGKDIKDLKPWAAYLQFELVNFARYPDWMYQSMSEVGPTCPTAYKAFDELAHHGQQLGVVRMGASTAPSAFGHFLPLTLANLPNLPAEIRALVPTDKAKQAEVLKQIEDPDPNDGFSPLPGAVAEKLRERSRQKLEGDLSWSALATLLEEEQFVEVANFMVVATNATETPLQGLVDSVLPLVKKHRFANYIESFTLGSVRDPGRLGQLFGKMPVRDPRWNMYPMFSRIGYLKDAQGSIGMRLMTEANRNFTLPDIVEFLFPVSSGATVKEPAIALEYANEARAIAPSSAVGTRLLVLYTPSPTSEDLINWERSAGDDSDTLLGLAQHHKKLGEKVPAVRCWEKSIAALPSVTSVTELAGFYHKEGDLKKWEETLTDFLQKPSLGLEHSVVERELAFGFAQRGDWKKAKPYALSAAETYSCLGLGVGTYITEGLGEWEVSEQLAKAEATSYPTNNGADWYFWCCRTGRGDVKSAEKLAAQYFALPQPHPNDTTYVVRGMYDVLQGNLQDARVNFRQAANIKHTFTYACVIAELSKELKDEPAAKQAITDMENELENPTIERKAEVVTAGKLLLDFVKNGNPSPERVAALEAALLKLGDENRNSAVGWCYFIGTELDAAGNKKEAEKYWRRSLIDATRDQILATFAGAKLAKHSGKSRPDDDPLAAKDMWPPLAAK